MYLLLINILEEVLFIIITLHKIDKAWSKRRVLVIR